LVLALEFLEAPVEVLQLQALPVVLHHLQVEMALMVILEDHRLAVQLRLLRHLVVGPQPLHHLPVDLQLPSFSLSPFLCLFLVFVQLLGLRLQLAVIL
jgi:hypothetical protein